METKGIKHYLKCNINLENNGAVNYIKKRIASKILLMGQGQKTLDLSK